MKIKELRIFTSMSQREFAEHFGLSVRSLQEWEQERSQPPAYLVGLLQRLLNSEKTNKPNQKNLYILDHYYAVNNADFCLAVRSDKTVEEMIEICSAITFLLEDLVDVTVSLDMQALQNILTAFYGVENIKKELSKEELKKMLPIEGLYKQIVPTAYIIDLYEARESCCGEKYKEIMDKWLPMDADRKLIEEYLKDMGVEE